MSEGEAVPSARAVQLTGATYRQLDHWAMRGWLQPLGAGGQGNPRRWPPHEVRAARIMVRLVDAGFMPDVAATVARKALAATVGTSAMRPVVQVTDDVAVVVRAS